MALANYVLLERITVGAAGAASVTFSNIPQTGYTDLKIVASVRSDYSAAGVSMYMDFNGVSTNRSRKSLYSNGATPGSGSASDDYCVSISAATATANTFANAEIYIPNYTSSNYKPYSADAVTENNAATAYTTLAAGLWSSTAAITSIKFTADGNFVRYSTFSLYGLAAVGTTPVIAPKAIGGDIIQTDGTYWYHAFINTGSFTPSTSIPCDVLVVAGGGASGNSYGGGGGAGGVIYFASQALTSGTGYTCSVGAGGAGSGATQSKGANGVDSYFGSLTHAIGGGGGGGNAGTPGSGQNGGSGGGGSLSPYNAGGTSTQTGTGATAYYGNAGGTNTATNADAGGGGAGAAGSAPASNTIGGNGGNGTTAFSQWGLTTNTGENVSSTVYFAGGGAGGGTGGTGTRGYGGGGAQGVAGTANTGGGGGGDNGSGMSGGSGVIIVRYLV
jgi:hypothetical protein